MKKFVAAVVIAVSCAVPVMAQEPPKAFTLTGTVGIVTDYRFRGVSQSDNKAAIQGGMTLAHASGFYGGFWASNLAGWGQFGGANLELDLIGGFKKSFGGIAVDIGNTWYMYPGGADKTDFAEPYVKVATTYGPVNLLAGIAYAPKQEALGKWWVSGPASSGPYNNPGDKKDNTYIWGDVSGAIPGTKATLKGHAGYSWGNSGLGPNGTSVTPTGEYLDWMLGVDYAIYGPVTLGFAYIDTNITKRESAYLQPNFSQVSNGKTIAGSRFVFSATAAF